MHKVCRIVFRFDRVDILKIIFATNIQSLWAEYSHFRGRKRWPSENYFGICLTNICTICYNAFMNNGAKRGTGETEGQSE